MRGPFYILTLCVFTFNTVAHAATPEERNTGLSAGECDSISNTEILDCNCLCLEDFYFDHGTKRCTYETANPVAVALRGPLQSTPLEACPKYVLVNVVTLAEAHASIHPDADFDGDGFSINQGDCDDTSYAIYPGAAEVPNNRIDEDCDGSLDVVHHAAPVTPVAPDPPSSPATGPPPPPT